jgi:predicted unusual protein kinase regulating ubiquinone biosynthesis (AarF/ABC1/UbiB family)
MRTLFITGRILRRDRNEVEKIFAEIQERLTEELDYYKEAANLEFFHRELAHIDGLSVPRTYGDLCTERVLTMDRIVGAPLDRFLETATVEARQRAGTILATSFHEQVYRLRALHADPHGGNYLFHTDGSVGLIDFGCVKRFDIWWLKRYADMALAIVDGDRSQFLEHAREMEILCVEGKPEAEHVLWKLAGTVCGPLRVPWYRCGVDEDQIPSDLKKLAPEIVRFPGLRSPPELVYLHRALGGIYAMLRRLEHEFDYSDIFRAHANYLLDVADGRTDDGAPVGWQARA